MNNARELLKELLNESGDVAGLIAYEVQQAFDDTADQAQLKEAVITGIENALEGRLSELYPQLADCVTFKAVVDEDMLADLLS